MRDIIWADGIRADYLSSLEYLAARNPSAARNLNQLVDTTILALAETPMGRRGRVAGTYETVLQKFPYIIAYALDPAPEGEKLVILGVIHTSRDWRDNKWPE